MKRLLKLSIILSVFTLAQASAATFYVSPTGSDSNSCTALTNPCKTISAGIAKAKSGDTTLVLSGTYKETVSIEKDNLTLAAYQSDKPIIDGGNSLPQGNWGVMLAINGNHNTVIGFEVKNANTTGKYVGGYGVEVNGHHNFLSKLNVHHSWETGILLGGDYNTVEDSIIWQNAFRNSSNTGQVTSGWATGMSAARNRSSEALKSGITSYATFRRNTVFNNWGEGLSCFEADFCTLEDNIVYDNWTINLYISDTSNSLIQRNLVYVSSNPAIRTRGNNGNSTITLADERNDKPRSRNNVVINNLLFGGGFNAFEWTEANNSGLIGVLIANNTLVKASLYTSNTANNATIIANNLIYNGVADIPVKTGLTLKNNSWDSSANPQLSLSGSTQAGQLTGNYFKILSNSPMIGKGYTLAKVSEDFFKKVRKATPDIGAHEFDGSVPSPDPVPVPDPVPTPTPVDKNVVVSVTMPTSVRTAIRQDAKAKKVSVSQDITAILKAYLQK